MLPNKFRYLVTGIIIGGTVATSGIAWANQQSVIAQVENWVTFVFNGVTQLLPVDYTVLNYNNRLYVPARFIAEQMGGTVQWDPLTQTVQISNPLQSQLQEKQQEIGQLNQQIANLKNFSSNSKHILSGQGFPDDHYKIEDLSTSLSYDNNGNLLSVTINGKLHNISSSYLRQRNVQVFLYDVNNTLLQSGYNPLNSSIAPNESQSFRVTIDNPLATIDHYKVLVQ